MVAELRIVLASQSPRRKELLSTLEFDYEIIPADIEEIATSYFPPQTAMINAILKADHIAKQHPEALVIGSDTVVEYQEKILGKPTDISHAKETLRFLSGKTHMVVTAVSLRSLNNNIKCDFSEKTEVTFKDLSDQTIDEYISLVNTLDKAGAYGIQSHSELLVKSITGPIDNVIGLPCDKLKQALNTILTTS